MAIRFASSFTQDLTESSKVLCMPRRGNTRLQDTRSSTSWDPSQMIPWFEGNQTAIRKSTRSELLQLQLLKRVSLILVTFAFLLVSGMSCVVHARQIEIFPDANHFKPDSKITEEEKSSVGRSSAPAPTRLLARGKQLLEWRSSKGRLQNNVQQSWDRTMETILPCSEWLTFSWRLSPDLNFGGPTACWD